MKIEDWTTLELITYLNKQRNKYKGDISKAILAELSKRQPLMAMLYK